MFHWKDGWFFWRQPDGSVSFEHRVYGSEKNELGELMYTIDAKDNIPPDSWCSIIASVSINGETSETFQSARKFHNDPLQG